MDSKISGHNIPIDKDKYFNVVDQQYTNLNELWDSICQQYQDKLESAEDESFFRFFIPNFLNFDLYTEDEDIEAQTSHKNVVKFLRNLRTLVKTMNCVFTITIDRDSLKSNAMLNYFIKYSDLVLDMKSFSDSKDKFLDYQGSIQILKEPTINGLIGNKSDHDIYVFKSDKKRFKIEVIHMDPDDDQPEKSGDKTKDDSSQKTASTTLWSSNPSTKDPLDF